MKIPENFEEISQEIRLYSERLMKLHSDLTKEDKRNIIVLKCLSVLLTVSAAVGVVFSFSEVGLVCERILALATLTFTLIVLYMNFYRVTDQRIVIATNAAKLAHDSRTLIRTTESAYSIIALIADNHKKAVETHELYLKYLAEKTILTDRMIALEAGQKEIPTLSPDLKLATEV